MLGEKPQQFILEVDYNECTRSSWIGAEDFHVGRAVRAKN